MRTAQEIVENMRRKCGWNVAPGYIADIQKEAFIQGAMAARGGALEAARALKPLAELRFRPRSHARTARIERTEAGAARAAIAKIGIHDG